MVFQVFTYRCWELDHKEGWVLKNWYFWTGVLETLLRVSWTASRSNQSILKEINLEYSWRDWCSGWSSNTLVTWCEELAHLKRPWCWERLKAGGEGDDRGQDGWMTSLNQWTWVWSSSRRWWRSVKPGVLQSMGSQRVRHSWASEQQQCGIWDSTSPTRDRTRGLCTGSTES